MKYTDEEKTALEIYATGKQPSSSTSIDEDTILMGYGRLDYDFEFPLPADKIKEIKGTNSWSEWFKLKGYKRWNVINNETKEVNELGMWCTDAEINDIKNLEGNENFNFLEI